MPKKDEKIDIQAMMEIYKKVGTPGEVHKRFGSLEGTWTTRTKSWMEPDKPPMETTGTCEQKLLLDGRYLQQVYTGDMMGEKFTGVNILGYDNHTKKYVSVWMDSMSTGIYFFEGTASRDGRTITQESSYDDPAKGPTVWRSVTRIKDDNTLQYEMFLRPKRARKEEKVMEMTVSRKLADVSKAA